MTTPLEIASSFSGAEILDVSRNGHGLINDTYLATERGGGRFILQRLNPNAFTEPALVMQNLRTIHDHVHSVGLSDGALRLPAIRKTIDNLDWHVDGDGQFWRALEYIGHSRSLSALQNGLQAEALGAALGKFHSLLADLDPAKLHVTLPGFHVTTQYLARYDALRLNSKEVSLEKCRGFIEARRDFAATLDRACARGELRRRPTHGDPKLDNFLFAENDDRVIGLIDLDTVQPGLIHHDLGDCLRSACNPAGECPADLNTVRFDIELACAILRGYLLKARRFLSATDARYLYDAIRLLPLELGLRFFTDHLEGDRYFRVMWPGQNLRRAETQFALCASIEAHEPELRKLIGELLAG